MTQLSEEDRQHLLKLIDGRITMLSGRLAGAEYPKLVALRRKLEGVDKRVMARGPDDRQIAYIREGRWPGVLVIVEETPDWGIKGYMPIPDGENVGKAYIRIENGKFDIVGTITEIENND